MSITHAKKPTAPSPIRHTSSPSASVFWLNQGEVRKRLKQAIRQLAQEHPEIEQVWLFGSLARGDAVPGSDADMMIVLRDSPLPFLDRSARFQPHFCGVGVDLFAYTRAELAKMEMDGNTFLRRIRSEGICLLKTRHTRKTAPDSTRRKRVGARRTRSATPSQHRR